MVEVRPALIEMMGLMAEAEDREDYEDAEAVADGLEVFVGLRQFSWRTVMAGLRLMAIKDATDEGGGARRFTVTDVGRLLLRQPAMEEDIIRAIGEDKAFSVIGDEIVHI